MLPEPKNPSTSSEATQPTPPAPPLADQNLEGFSDFEKVQQEFDPNAPEVKANDETAAQPALPTFSPDQVYSAKDLMTGTTALTMLALRATGREITSKHVGLFKAAIEWAAPNVIRTDAVLEQMEIGQAMAQLGIIKGSIPGLGETKQVDPKYRLAAGALVLGFAVWGGIHAIGKAEQNERSRAA